LADTAATGRSGGGFLHSVCSSELEGVRARTQSRHWRVVVTLAGTALSIFLCYPWKWRHYSEENLPWKALRKQIAHPLQARDYPPESHPAKKAFRLTVPVFVRATGIGIPGAIVVQLLSGVALLYLTVSVGFVATQDRVTATLGCLATAATYLGASAFWDYRGNFDSLAICFLLAAMLARSAALVAVLVFLAAFTDERALVAALLVHFWFVVRRLLQRADGGSAWMPRPSWGIVVAAIAYAAVRTFLAWRFHLTAPVGDSADVGLAVFRRQLDTLPFGVWSALEGLWLPVMAALGLLWARRFRLAAAGVAGILALLVLCAHMVWDVTRSAMYVFPVVFIAAATVAAREAQYTVRATYLMAAFVSVIVPTAFVQGNAVSVCRTLPTSLAKLFW
jgi:hypothetical protein